MSRRVIIIVVFVLFTFFPSALIFSQIRLLKKAETKLLKKEYTEAYSAVQQYISNEGEKTESSFMLFRIALLQCDKIEDADRLVILLNKLTNDFDYYNLEEKEKWCKEISFCLEQLKLYKTELELKVYDLYTKSDSVYFFKRFLEKYPQSHYRQEARARLSKLLYTQIKRNPNKVDLVEFIREYKDLHEYESALNLLWQIEFESAVKLNSEDAYLDFIKTYPNSPHVQSAYRNAQEIYWQNLHPFLTIPKLENYLNKYPNAFNKKEVTDSLQMLLWATMRDTQKEEVILDFINRFPNSKYNDSAFGRINLLSRRIIPFLTKNFRYIFSNKSGEFIEAQNEFDDIVDVWPNGYIVLRNKGKFYLWNTLAKQIVVTASQSLIYVSEKYFFAQVNNKWGLMNAQGKFIVSPNFESIAITSQNKFIISTRQNNQSSRFGLIDENGKYIFEPRYDRLLYFDGNNMIGIEGVNHTLLGISGRQSNKVYSGIQPLQSGYFIGYNQNQVFLIDSAFREISKLSIRDIFDLHNHGFAEKVSSNKIIFRNLLGIKYLELDAFDLKYLGDGLVAVKLNQMPKTENWAIYSLSRKQTITNILYESVGDVSEGLFSVVIHGKLGYLDTSGTMVVSPRYEPINSFKNIFNNNDYTARYKNISISDISTLKKNHKDLQLFEGFDRNDWESNPTEFKDGLCAVVVDGKIGFINRRGDYIIHPQYSRASNFANGIAMVQIRSEGGTLNKVINQTNEVVADEYELIGNLNAKNEVIFRKLNEDFSYSYMKWDVNTKSMTNIIEGVQQLGYAMNHFIFKKLGKNIFLSPNGKTFVGTDIDWSNSQSNYYISIAKRFVSQRNFVLAENYLDKAISADPLNPETWIYYGKFLIENDEIEKAESLYKKVINEKIDSSIGFRGLITLSLRASDWSSSIELYKELLKLKPTDSLQLLLGLASCQIQLQKISDAISTYSKYLSKVPKSSLVYNNRGYCYLLQREFQSSFSDFNNAVQFSQNDNTLRRASYFNNRGISNMALGKRSQACLDFTKSSNLGNIDAMNNQRSYCR
jgi:Flp pilus assembly protein TadD